MEITFWTISDFFLLLDLPELTNLTIYINNLSRIFQFWTLPEVLNSEQFQNFNFLHNSIILNFLMGPKLFHAGPLQNFCFVWPFQNFYILDHSKIGTFWPIPEIFTFWTISKFLHSGPFKKFTFRTISDFFLHCGPFQNFYILDHSIIIVFWIVPEFFSSILTSQEFLHSI